MGRLWDACLSIAFVDVMLVLLLKKTRVAEVPDLGGHSNSARVSQIYMPVQIHPGLEFCLKTL